MMKTLFLHPPSFDGFDGGAGSRYQAKREIRSFWYPTWLAQPAALLPDSKLIDAPPARLKLDQVLPLAREYELAVLHTSTPSFASDVRVAAFLPFGGCLEEPGLAAFMGHGYGRNSLPMPGPMAGRGGDHQADAAHGGLIGRRGRPETLSDE